MRVASLICGAVLAALTAAGPATAGQWDGFYAGFNGGNASASELVTAKIFSFLSNPGQSFPSTFSSDLYGGQLGWNRQAGPLLFGIEGTVDGASMSQFQVGVLQPGTFPDDQFTTSLTDFATITGRLGLTSGSWLGYVKGGFAVATVGLDVLHTPPPHPFPQFTQGSTEATGWTAGVGVEKMFGGRFIVGIEYDRAQLAGSLTTDGTAGAPFDISDIVVSSVVGRVSIKLP